MPAPYLSFPLDDPFFIFFFIVYFFAITFFFSVHAYVLLAINVVLCNSCR